METGILADRVGERSGPPAAVLGGDEGGATVSFEGERAPTLSKAADLARTKVLEAQGETATVNTNGWTFWSYVDAEGKPRPVDELRRRYLEADRAGKSAS